MIPGSVGSHGVKCHIPAGSDLLYASQAERVLLNTFDVAIIVCVIFNHGCHPILLNLI